MPSWYFIIYEQDKFHADYEKSLYNLEAWAWSVQFELLE